MEGRQPDVSAAGAIAALFFEMVQEGADEGGSKIFKAQRRWRLLKTLLCKTEEHAEGVAVARNGMRARLPLAHETISEECLEQRREVDGLHRSASLCSRRRVANCKSSGTAEMYQ